MSVALITGCSSGLGMSTALELARKGVKVYASMRDTTRSGPLTEKAAAEGLNIELLELDVANPASVHSAVAAVTGREPGIDILVNNAGIGIPGAFEDLSEDDFRRVMETNLYGPFRMTRAVLPGMRARRAGIIIMVSSLSGLVGLPADSAYAASKFALEGMTESLCYEVRRFNIRVALIQPGAFRTAMGEKLATAAHSPEGSPYHALMDFHAQRIRRSLGSGDDPLVVAKVIVEVTFAKNPPLRHPAGRQAEEVSEALRHMSQRERARMIMDVTGIKWWDEGWDSPP